MLEELQLIYLILHKKSLEPLFANDLIAEYFVHNKNIVDFILKFNAENMELPTLETVISNFPDVEAWPEEEENAEYLAKQIKEEYVFHKTREILSTNEGVLQSNSFEGLNKIKVGLEQLLKINESQDDSLIDRKSDEFDKTVSYITSGFKLLDNQIGGFRSQDELVTLIGRTRMGKSWILLKMLLESWKQGMNVGLYSGEMDTKDIADRFDALNINRSNKEIAEGLYNNDPSYKKYKEDLADNDTKFVIKTFKTLGRRAMVQDIEAMIVKHNLKVIGVDQLSLMTDQRYKRGDGKREAYDNISMDLFHLAEKYNVVIILLVQLNREGAKGEFPTLENIAESDAVAQNSSKVVAINRDKDNVLTMRTLKNRYGSTGKDVKYIWDIDLGLFNELINDKVDNLEGSDDIFI